MLASALALTSCLWTTACSPFLLPVTPTEPLRAGSGAGAREDGTFAGTSTAGAGAAVEIAVDRILVGDDMLATGVENESTIGVVMTVTNRGTEPYHLVLARTSLWMALDSHHPEDTHAWPAIGAGEGAPPDDLTVVPAMPVLDVAPGQSARAWVMFLGYRFEESELPRRITLNVPGPGGDTIRVTLADPARGSLRWQLPAQRSQTMVGFQNVSFLGGRFLGTGPTTSLARVAWVGRFWWDFGLASGVAIQQKGALMSSTSAFSTIGVFAHLTLPFASWGPGRDVRRLGVYAGGGAAVWGAILSDDETKAGKLPSINGVLTVDGGLEWAFGRLLPAGTPFPLEPQPRLALPRWAIRLGYTQAWLAGGTAGGLVTTFRLAF